MPIAVLDAQTVGRIAAGEVVERPSSVAKELIENALDAGATAITVEIREGGSKYLRVTDNGCGIAPNEARLAFENHATSKIQSGDLLDDLRTMGFRGEALPSIAAVARVTMTTRQRGAEAGVRLKVEGGRFGAAEAIGCPEGTTVVVEDLFYNLPARQAFLKKPATEAGAVSDLVQRMILGYPGVTFRYMQNGRTIYHSGGDGNLRHAAFAIYGRTVAEKLEIIEGAEGATTLRGFVGVGELSRPSRSSECFFVNGRSVRCPLLARTVEEVLAGRVLTNMYPICVLSLTVPPGSVDVNVHPGKLEVRFRDESLLRLTVEAILAKALKPNSAMLDAFEARQGDVVRVEVRSDAPVPETQKQTPVVNKAADNAGEKQTEVSQTTYARLSDAASPTRSPVYDEDAVAAYRAQERAEMEKKARADLSNAPRTEENPPDIGATAPRTGAVEKRTEPNGLRTEKSTPETPPAGLEPTAWTPPRRETAKEEIEQTAMSPESLGIRASFRVIGVFLNAYILVEAGEKLIMIDQHAAHERILFERFQKEIGKGIAMQTLMLPEVFPATARETAIVADNREALLEAGYDAEPLGERAVQVRAVPYILGQTVTRPLFLEMIDNLDRLKDTSLEMRHQVIITASCKHAIKAGDPLTDDQIEELVRIMATTDAPPVCAHGRPVLKVWTRGDVEKMFKRT